MAKKKNPADATLRNVRASRTRDEAMDHRVDMLAKFILELSSYTENINGRLTALEIKAATKGPRR